uniref:Small ribosomal subunit protein uS9c n=1 Tax=Atractomorpha echinata TaxID=52677 RepID=A0A140GIP1_9CHLO|nr:ribosomal protein S9 [Atractomorpha echinata]
MTQTINSRIFSKAVGRRKESVAQVQLREGTGQFIINNKPADIYLQNNSFSLLSIKAPFEVLHTNIENSDGSSTDSLKMDQIDTIVKVEGGGLIGQTEAIKLAVARAICVLTEIENNVTGIRQLLKTKGHLTQDARIKERRKYGLKKARKASQYHKR